MTPHIKRIRKGFIMFFVNPALISLLLACLPILAGAENSGEKPPAFFQFVPLIFVFLIVYLLFIRPAQKRHKQQIELVKGLKKGDQVITSSGILGTVYGLTDTFVTLEVSANTRIRILTSHISALADKESDKK